MSMNLRQIEVFRAVMSTGSISGAAQMLHVSQPAVSRLLSYTEGKIGFALFERIKGRLYATPEAKRLFREVEGVYAGVQRVNELAHELAERRRGFLHVMSSPSIGQWLIPQAISTFRVGHADVHVTLSFQNYAQVKDRLLDLKADVGVVILPMEHPNLEVTPVGQAHMVCICPPQHPLAGRGTLGLRELRPYPMISYDPDTPFGTIVGQMYQTAGEALVSSLEVGSPQNACALVATGAGIALVDEFSARSWQATQLVARPIAAAPALTVNIVHARFEPLSQLAQSFVDILRATMVREGFELPSPSTPVSNLVRVLAAEPGPTLDL
jgi:DNA-binding transcriptional LysR family regulator